MLSSWVKLVRANFLLLTVVVFWVGVVGLVYDGFSLDFLWVFVCFLAALLSHVSVNVLNNYFDFRSGVDAVSIKTPFSGGVDVLVRGEVKPTLALFLGVLSGFFAVLLAVPFILACPLLVLPVVVYGGLAVSLYTPVFSRIPALAEPIAGTGFSMMVLWCYVSQACTISVTAICLYIISAFLVGLLLFLNEFPDLEADLRAGRRHMVILLGRRRAAKLYGIWVLLVVFANILFVLLGFLPYLTLISLISVPFAYSAYRRICLKPDDLDCMVYAMAKNLLFIMLFLFLLGLGVFLSCLI